MTTHSIDDIARTNRRFTLAARPQGRPVASDFHLEQGPAPVPGDGQVLLRTLWISLDPYVRNLMDEVGPGYAAPMAIGSTIVGSTVSRVVTSRHPRFRAGELVVANAGWQDFSLSDGSDVQPLGDIAHPSHALGGLGMPGFTAYIGLLEIGQPRTGETVVVAAATGAVGAMVGQLAKLQGARVVGIAGSSDKARYAVQELGFDACLNRHEVELAANLAQACPRGIDVYFENVGGDVLDAVLPLLNIGARIPVCGFIAHYNDAAPLLGVDRRLRLLASVLQKRIRMQGFIILDHYGERFETFQRQAQRWLNSGHIRLREDVVEGLENAPTALQGLLEGRNFGKLVVRVADD